MVTLEVVGFFTILFLSTLGVLVVIGAFQKAFFPTE